MENKFLFIEKIRIRLILSINIQICVRTSVLIRRSRKSRAKMCLELDNAWTSQNRAAEFPARGPRIAITCLLCSKFWLCMVDWRRANGEIQPNPKYPRLRSLRSLHHTTVDNLRPNAVQLAASSPRPEVHRRGWSVDYSVRFERFFYIEPNQMFNSIRYGNSVLCVTFFF